MDKDNKKKGLAVIVLLICLFAIVVWYKRTYNNNISRPIEIIKPTETMAPLNEGTFRNNYQRGKCNTGSFERTDCSVGNCPLDTNISDAQYCNIQCAQEIDKVDRTRCYNQCMAMMKSGCH